MFSSLTDTLFAVKLNAFDLKRMLGYFNEQYQEYLQKTDGMLVGEPAWDEAVDAATLLGEDDAENKYLGYKIVLNNPVLLNHLHDFFDSRNVACIKEYRDDENQCALVISKASLEDAHLTNKDEGEYLFTLHQKFQACLEKREAARQELSRSAGL